MRELIRKLGRLNTVILITVFSVLLSVTITFVISYSISGYENLAVALPISMVVPLIAAPASSWPLMGLLIKIDHLEKEMRELATFDSLTGLLGRRAFFHDAKSFINLAKRERISFSVIVLDLDKFKTINDKHGHLAGDEVLKHFASTIKSLVRKSDLIGRLGGEEFALLLPNTSRVEVCALSERLHQSIRRSNVYYDKVAISYSVSMGVVSLGPNEMDTIESALKQADQSLYHAKEKGRDRTVFFEANKARVAGC